MFPHIKHTILQNIQLKFFVFLNKLTIRTKANLKLKKSRTIKEWISKSLTVSHNKVLTWIILYTSFDENLRTRWVCAIINKKHNYLRRFATFKLQEREGTF